MDSRCCICNCEVNSEDAAILAMSGYGSPRYICDGCDGELSLATGARELSDITEAMDRVSKKMTVNNVGDPLVLKSVEEIMTEARERAEKIKSGSYDFSEEEQANRSTEAEEVPEELLETEEDRELDRKEAEKNKKLDKITNIVCITVLVAALGFLVYKMLSSWL